MLGNWSDPNVRLSDLEVRVQLIDDARDGCWTNLREVREYIEEKLYSRGVKQLKEMDYSNPSNYNLFLSVLGMRLYEGGTGPCGGTFDLEIKKSGAINGWWHSVTMYESVRALYFREKNLNTIVLDYVREVINSLP